MYCVGNDNRISCEHTKRLVSELDRNAAERSNNFSADYFYLGVTTDANDAYILRYHATSQSRGNVLVPRTGFSDEFFEIVVAEYFHADAFRSSVMHRSSLAACSRHLFAKCFAR